MNQNVFQIASPAPVDVLILSEHPIWPAQHGVGLRGYHMALALAGLGWSVRLSSWRTALAREAAPPAITAMTVPWAQAGPDDQAVLARGWHGPLAALRRRLLRHQGLEPADLAGAVPLVRMLRPRIVLGLGLHSPVVLRGLQGLPAEIRPPTIWYAADEMILYNLSCLRHEGPARWPQRFQELLLHGLLERLFVPRLDGAIGVSPLDARLLVNWAGAPRSVTVRNGVDLDFFAPQAGPAEGSGPLAARSIIFWGRLDFAPNADAVLWFAHHVWPQLQRRHTDARWYILGPSAGPQVQALGQVPGIEVVGEVADIRPWARRAGAVVLPLRCGAGIKNKLLEAAALGRPIIASPRAVAGLDFGQAPPPLMVCDQPPAWGTAIRRLWSDSVLAARLAREGRQWVQRHHSWPAAAATLQTWLQERTDAVVPGAARRAA